MKGAEDIERIAAGKLQSAQVLFENKYFDEAYYIAGYYLELLLKSRICKILSIDNFFDDGEEWLKKIRFPQVFKTHNLESLLILSGLYLKFINEFMNGDNDEDYWSIIESWNEKSRYSSNNKKKDVAKFINKINVIGTWIKRQS